MSLTFLAPLFLWALLGIPLVIVLHFIRSRKRRQDVSALFLWKKAAEIAQARRRFSPSWLLLLQILFVALASLALSQPHLVFQGAPDRVLVIDASASMAARDGDGVRLDKALVAAGDLLAGGGRVAVVRAGLDATVVQPLSADRNEVAASLERLVAADREASLERALDLAASIVPEGEVHLITDQPAPPGLAPGVGFHPVGGDGANLGISTFDIGLQQAYVAVVSTSARPQEVPLELRQEERIVAQTTLLVPAGGQANATFPIQVEGFVEAHITVPDWDALPLDNTAFTGSRELLVVVDEAPVPLQRALDAIPGIRWRRSPVADRAPADVRILTGADPSGLAAGRYLLFEPARADATFRQVRDWDQGDPLLRFVDLRGTVVGVSADWQVPDDDPGWRVLARTGDLTPVLRRFETPELRIVQAAFHPSQTDMVFRPAFPTLMTNLLRDFRGEERLPLGSPLPDGAMFDERPTDRATQPGLYQVEGRLLSASLLSAAESRLPGVPAAVPAVTPPSEAVERQRGASLWLVLIALIVLLAEWLVWSGARPRRWRRLRRS